MVTYATITTIRPITKVFHSLLRSNDGVASDTALWQTLRYCSDLRAAIVSTRLQGITLDRRLISRPHWTKMAAEPGFGNAGSIPKPASNCVTFTPDMGGLQQSKCGSASFPTTERAGARRREFGRDITRCESVSAATTTPSNNRLQ